MQDAAYINIIESDLLSICNNNKDEAMAVFGRNESPLLKCMNLAGLGQGLHFKSIPLERSYKITSLISAIALESQATARKVSLSGNWWKYDCGSMVAFTKE